MSKSVQKTLRVLLYVFAAIGIIFTGVFIAMQLGLLNVRGANSARNQSLGINTTIPSEVCADNTKTHCNWNETPEWNVLKEALTKDAPVINDVATKTGVPSRMIVATVIPEQLRYFTANRESFKKYFEPLKILSSLSKFSLGVSGIKQDTARAIERYASDPTSQLYPGPGMAALVAYPDNATHDTELYNRLTDAHNHYYSYLYTALFIKEIQMQWIRAGFDISNKPDIIVTLFNIGFAASSPNSSPQVGGAPITLGATTYSYGELGTLFYHSPELEAVFPQWNSLL